MLCRKITLRVNGARRIYKQSGYMEDVNISNEGSLPMAYTITINIHQSECRCVAECKEVR